MKNQALAAAVAMVSNPPLPSSDVGFSPELARDIIGAYHKALKDLVVEVHVDQGISEMRQEAPTPATEQVSVPVPMNEPDEELDYLTIMGADGVYHVMELRTSRSIVAVAASKEYADLIVTALSIS